MRFRKRESSDGVEASYVYVWQKSIAIVLFGFVLWIIDGDWRQALFYVLLVAFALPVNLYVARHRV